MPSKSYFEKIEENIKKKEKELGRKLSIKEQDEAKTLAMAQLYMEADRERIEEEKKAKGN